jgi:hypothetical protein
MAHTANIDEDSDATVVMKDDAEEDTYSMSDKMHGDSDATVMINMYKKLNKNGSQQESRRLYLNISNPRLWKRQCRSASTKKWQD